MPKDDKTPRQRMVVEEVKTEMPVEVPQETVEPASNASSIAETDGEIAQKVEEPQVITEPIPVAIENPTEVHEQTVEVTPKITPEQVTPPRMEGDRPYSSNSGPNPMTIILPGILLLGAILGGIFFYQRNTSIATPETDELGNEEVVEVTETPTPTPAAEADLTKYKISVFNGGGTVGEAGKAKTLLEDAGFVVSATANAKDYSFTKTIIGAKSTVDKGFLDALSTALGKTYIVGTNEMIASSSADSVIVTIGSSKK